MTVSIQIPYDTGIPEKLEILRLERGVSINMFIVQALAEKLKRDGYIDSSRIDKKEPVRKKRQLRTSIDMEWLLQKMKK